MAKKVVKFCGLDLATLNIGERATIQLEDGRWISTSPIVRFAGRFEIETQNTIYLAAR